MAGNIPFLIILPPNYETDCCCPFIAGEPGLLCCHCCSVAKSCVTSCKTPWTALSPGVCSNSCSLSWWCYLTISSSATPFSFCLQSFLVSGSFPISWIFASGGRSIRASASASVLPMNIQSWFPLGLTDFISLQSYGLSRVFSSTTIQKHQFFALSLLYGPTLKSICDYWKNIVLTIWTLAGKVMSLVFNTLSSCIGSGCPSFSSKEQASFNLMAAVTTCRTPWYMTKLEPGLPNDKAFVLSPQLCIFLEGSRGELSH